MPHAVVYYYIYTYLYYWYVMNDLKFCKVIMKCTLHYYVKFGFGYSVCYFTNVFP